MMSLWDALRMNMMISYQELVRTFLRSEYDLHHFPRLFSLPYCPACFSWSAICSFTFCVRTPLSGIFWLFIRSS
ncbi:hypothetical protein D9I89_25600 [Escherichia coli]|nr:hypothetical protein [Escherichia coli]